MRQFVDDNECYLAWIATNPDGFVVNSYRKPTAAYLILHNASCHTISGDPARGNEWTRDYAKTCAATPAELQRWAADEVGGTLRRCQVCCLPAPRSSDTERIAAPLLNERRMVTAGGAARRSAGSPSYLISTSKNCVEAWSVKRLPFGPRGWLRDFRDEIRDAVGGLSSGSGQALQIEYVAEGNEPCDVENVLLYNVGASGFAASAQRCLRFERSFAKPPTPPIALPGRDLHYHRYRVVSETDTFAFWARDAVVAQWRGVKSGPVKSDSKPAPIWYRMKLGEVEAAAHAATRLFGLSVTLEAPQRWGRPLNLAAIVKPLFDGIIASFHVHDGSRLDDVSARVGRELGIDDGEVAARLTAVRATPLGKIRLLHPFGRMGIQWNPADDRLVAAELRLGSAESGSVAWKLSGELFDAGPIDAVGSP